jgi:hypothetical protein
MHADSAGKECACACSTSVRDKWGCSSERRKELLLGSNSELVLSLAVHRCNAVAPTLGKLAYDSKVRRMSGVRVLLNDFDLFLAAYALDSRDRQQRQLISAREERKSQRKAGLYRYPVRAVDMHAEAVQSYSASHGAASAETRCSCPATFGRRDR